MLLSFLAGLLAGAFGGLVGSYTHWRLGNVVTKILPGLILGSIAGSFLGGSLANYLSEAALRRSLPPCSSGWGPGISAKP